MGDSEKQVTIALSAAELAPFSSFIEQEHAHPAAAYDVITSSSSRTSPCVAVLSSGSNTTAMIVARVADSELEWKLGYARVGQSRARVARVVTGGMMGDLSREEDAALLCRGFLGFLAAGGADVVELAGVRAGSALHHAALGSRHSLLHDVTSPQPHWWLKLPGSSEEFVRSRSSNTKSMIRQCRNRVARTFGDQVELRRFRKPEEVKTAFEQIELVAAKSYQRALKVGFLPSAELERQATYDAERGWFAAFVLYLGGKPCAFWSGSIYRGIFTSYATGFDPALAACQPGTFLLLSMIDSFYEGDEVRAIDFGAGEADYKRKFGSENHEEVSLLLFAPNARGLGLALLSNGTTWANALAKNLLGGPALKRVKAFWRRRLQQEPAEEQAAPPEKAQTKLPAFAMQGSNAARAAKPEQPREKSGKAA